MYLAVALVALCEIITERQILAPLRSNDSQARAAEQSQIYSTFASPVDPEIIMECDWGGNNPGGLNTTTHFCKNHAQSTSLERLFIALNGLFIAVYDKTLFVLPSFQELGLNDFCRFGHLPVYPIGMITTYALNADGAMMSPLSFLIHDIAHMSALVGCTGEHGRQRPSYSPGDRTLRTWQRRLELRCLLLDQRPACLEPLELDPALVLLLFYLLHEQTPNDGAPCLNYSNDGFALCFSMLGLARREARAGLVEEYQSVTDTQAARAALWTLCLWKCWQTADFGALTQKQREACAQNFERRERPRLEQHLAFIERHRGALRQLFADRHCIREGKGTPSDSFSIDSRYFKYRANSLPLFQIRHERSGLCHLDNTDLIYFHALSSPVLRKQMESVTGASLPPCLPTGREQGSVHG